MLDLKANKNGVLTRVINAMGLERRQTGGKADLAVLCWLIVMLIILPGCNGKEKVPANPVQQSSAPAMNTADELSKAAEVKPSQEQEQEQIKNQANTPPLELKAAWQDYGAREPGWESPMQDNGELFFDSWGWGFGEDIASFSISKDKTLQLRHVSIKNGSKKSIVVKPINIEIEIDKIDGDNKTSIVKYTMPTITGIFKGRGWYVAELPPWSFVDGSGYPVSPGKYVIDMHISPVQYYLYDDENKQYKTESRDRIFGACVVYRPYEFEITE